jgi:hypothetical protein
MFRRWSLSPRNFSGSLLFVGLDRPGRNEVQSRLVVLAGSKVFCANSCHAVDLEYLPIINLDRNVPSLDSFHAILCLDCRETTDKSLIGRGLTRAMVRAKR